MDLITIPIPRIDLEVFLAKLAQVILFDEAHGRSAINIKIAVSKLTEYNREVADMWRRVQEAALIHHRDVVPKINALKEEFGNKRIIG